MPESNICQSLIDIAENKRDGVEILQGLKFPGINLLSGTENN